MAQIISSFCGCITLLISDLFVIDSNRLPLSDLQIWKLILNDSQELEINQTFSDKDEFLVYLNTTFVSVYGLNGFFTLSEDIIYYSNPENFEKLEIVAILETTILRYGMGSALPINKPSTPVINSNVIADSALQDVEVLLVQVDSGMRQPITANGWLHDPNAGTLTFDTDNPPMDTNIYVLIKQTI